MEISIKNSQFRIKSKTGLLYTLENGVRIETSDGSYSKDLIGTGEYEVSGISVLGIPINGGSAFVYEIDGLRICNLSGITEKIDDAKISAIGDIDILLLPINSLTEVIYQQIESYFIIPFDYKNTDELEKFLKSSGYMVQRLPKFNIKKDECPPMGDEESPTQIIVLESKN